MLAYENQLNQLPSELDSQFDVAGQFYVHSGRARTYDCRNLLEIRLCSAPASTEADAVFIMMNPGSSTPLRGGTGETLAASVLVPTKPDTTQYQLMRVMAAMGWRRVKVLNLSDLRVTRSTEFFKQVEEFQAREGHGGHSLFARTRRQELLSALSRKNGAPVVAAWGVNRALRKLALQAQEALKGTSLFGLPHGVGPWAFRHPLPRNANLQSCWRRDALSMLRTAPASLEHAKRN